MKKIITLILSITLVFSFASVAYAEGTENEDYFIYQGETYYTAQKDNPAADLQPGEQIDFQLSDNANFKAGLYKLTVVSCGNRESIPISINGTEVGTITRKGNGFGMDQMSNDVLETEIELAPTDTLSIIGMEGDIYGWVDYIVLDKAAADSSDETVSEDANGADKNTTDNTEAALPKTGSMFPAYLLGFAFISAVGIIVSKKVIKVKETYK